MPGPDYHPVATGAAHDIVAKHAGPADIVLWGGWFCPFTQRTWAVLEAKEISPRGLTPGLQINGRTLHDSNIINEFLEETSNSLGADPTAPSLWPAAGDDAYEKARARLWIDHINKAVVPAFIRLLQAPPATQAIVRTEFNTALAHISAHCKGPFFYGENISLVDLAIVPWAVRDFIIRDARGFHRDDVPGWTAWAEALEQHPSVKGTTSDPEKYLEFNQTFMHNKDHSAVGKAARAGQQIL